MINKGGNMTTIKYQNRSLILNILKRTGSVSRADIAQMLELTPAAITILVNEMVDENIIVEAGHMEEDKRSGRKKILIDINSNFKHVIGVNIETDYTNIGISNLKGETVDYKRFPTDKSVEPEQLLQRITSECLNMLWKANIQKENVLGLGVGIVGKVDQQNGISEHAYALWDKKVDIGRILQDSLDVRITIENNVRALALGELEYYNPDETSNILFVKYGPGIGSAITINNEIYYGNHKEAGEIGHTIVDFEGPLCKCGRYGCLETIASEKAVIEKIKLEFTEQKTPKLYELCSGSPDNITISNIYKAAEAGDPLVEDCIRTTAKYMALAIANAVTLYDPNKVILYGKAFENGFFMDAFIGALSRLIAKTGFDEYVLLSKLNRKSNFIAGTALALREFFYNTGGLIES